MPLHKNLAGSDLHEPKDIATSSINTVYVSNGSGSGAWESVPGTNPSNVITIDIGSDFPAPVGDVITLANNTLYLLGGTINIGGSRIVMGVNSVIEGVNRQLTNLVSSTSGNLITATAVDCRISCVNFDAPSATKIVSFDGNSVSAMRLSDCKSITHTGICIESTNCVSTVIEFCLFIGGTTGLSLKGSNNTNMLIDTIAIVSFSGIGIDFGTSVFDDCTIKASLLSGLGGSFSISGLASSGNINAGRRCSVLNTTFNGDGTPLQTITSQDLRFIFLANFGIENTKVAGQMFLSGSALTTTLAAATPAKINATTWTSSTTDRVSVDSSGTLTYNGIEDIEVIVNLAVNGSGASGSNEFNIYIAKNGTVLAESKARATMPSTSDTNLMTFSLVNISTGDTLEPFVEQAAGVDFNAKDANMSVKL